MMSSSRPRHQEVRLKASCSDKCMAVFLDLQCYLHRLPCLDRDTVNSIVLKSVSTFENLVDRLEWKPLLNTNNSPSNSILGLTELISSLGELDSDTIKTFIELLLNLEGCGRISNLVRKRIFKNFGDIIEVIQLPEPDTTPPPETLSHLHPSESSVTLLPPTSDYIQLSIENLENSCERKSFFWKSKKAYIGCAIGFCATFTMAVILYFVLPHILALLFGNVGANPIPNDDSSLSLSTNVPQETPPVFINSSSKTIKVAIPPKAVPPVHFIPLNPIARSINTVDATTTKKHKLRLDITSFSGYTQVMKKIPSGRDVIMSVHIHTPNDWPNNDIPLPNSSEITKLSLDGPFTVDQIINILRQVPNTQHLHLKNTNNKLCARNNGQLNLVKSITTKVYLPVVKTIVIQGFTRCSEVYEALANNLQDMPGLKRFAIFMGVIDDANHFFVQQLIRHGRDTLKEVMFPESSILTSTPLFEVSSGLRLKRLSILRADSINVNGAKGIIPLGEKMLKSFPNLRAFTSDHGYISWRNVSNILTYKNLTKLQIGIQIPHDHNSFTVAFLRKCFPILKTANITIYFEECSQLESLNGGKIPILGWETVREALINLTVRSNCKIFPNFSSTPHQMRQYREEKYLREWGMHGFAYRILDDRRK